MFIEFLKKNIYVVPTRTWAADILMELPDYFTDLRYYDNNDHSILYKKGMDARECLKAYLNYSIMYYQEIVDFHSHIDAGSVDDSLHYQNIIKDYKKTISDIEKSLKKLSV